VSEVVGISVTSESEEGVEASVHGPERLRVVTQIPLADHVGLVAVRAEVIANGGLVFGKPELGSGCDAFMLHGRSFGEKCDSA